MGVAGTGSDGTFVQKGDLSALIEQAIVDLPEYIDQIALEEHEAETENVHGIPDTATLVTESDLSAYVGVIEFAEAIEELEQLIGEIEGGSGVTKEELDSAVEVLETKDTELNEAISARATKTELTDHAADTTSVHGITNTANLAVKSEVEPKASKTELTEHSSDTTSVHGISNTANLELSTNKVQTLSGESESEYPSEKAVQLGLAAKYAIATSEASNLGVVVHGSTAGTSRPSGYKQVVWIGSVEPTNKSTNDLWFKT